MEEFKCMIWIGDLFKGRSDRSQSVICFRPKYSVNFNFLRNNSLRACYKMSLNPILRFDFPNYSVHTTAYQTTQVCLQSIAVHSCFYEVWMQIFGSKVNIYH